MSDCNSITELDQIGDEGFKRAFKFFSRHLVGLSLSYKLVNADGSPSAEEQNGIFSGFILSIRGLWCWVTAGHILKPLQDALKENQIKITQGFLLDNFRPSPVTDAPIPFDYESSPKMCVYDKDEGLDFGLILLDPHYKRLLEANGAVAVTRENWIHQQRVKFDHYFLLGLPSKFLSAPEKTDSSVIMRTGVSMVRLREVNSLPSNLTQTNYPRLILKIDDGWTLDDISGMSGGPIFGFSDEEKDRYWVVAVQSRWLKQERVICACPVTVFAEMIEAQIDNVGVNAEDK